MFNWCALFLVVILISSSIGISGIEAAQSSIITNSSFKKIQNDADRYKGKWVKLSGQITQEPLDYGRDGIWMVFDYSQGEGLVSTSRVWLASVKDFGISEGDCIVAEGKILGSAEIIYEFTGASNMIPLIGLEKLQETSCIEAKYPAYKSYTINKSQTKGNIKVTIEKLEFTKWHTRIFASVENLGTNDIHFDAFSSKIIQDKKQFKPKYSFFTEIDEISYDIPEGVIEDGILLFDPAKLKTLKIQLKAFESILEEKLFAFEIKFKT